MTSSNDKTKQDDAALIRMVQGGDQQAFATLMRRYKDPITSFAYRFLGNYDDAVDVAQETFVRLYKYSATYTGDVKFNTWLYTIASNLAKSELAKFWRKNSIAFSRLEASDDDIEWEIADEHYMPDARVDSTTIAQHVQSALLKISPSYREAVILRDVQQLAYEEIAEVMQLEIGTVKSRINRGRQQLQLLLKPMYDEMFSE